MVETMQHREGSLRLILKTNWVKGLLVLGVGAGGTMALCMAVLGLFEHDPKEGFALLRAWGPWAMVVALALLLIWKMYDKAIATVNVGVAAWVRTADQGAQAQVRSADAQTRTADALSRLAEQGGRSAEEVRRLTVYAAQEFPTVYERLDKQDVVLKDNQQTLVTVVGALNEIKEFLRGSAEQARKDGA